VHGFFASLSMTEEERGVRRHRHSQVSVERRERSWAWCITRVRENSLRQSKGRQRAWVLRFAQNDKVRLRMRRSE
jgi:hypothetical protein